MATNTAHATSQASVSESNRSRIVKHLYHNGISSRAQIAKALELTPAAITKITARLIEAGMIEETGDLEGSKNRRSIGLKLNTTRSASSASNSPARWCRSAYSACAATP